MKGYRFLADTLVNYGVTNIFYMESFLENMTLELKKKGVKGILAHSENGAGYMADGYARCSGRPGICLAQSIGTANLAGGIYDAALANSPVIAITGKKPGIFQYTGAYQEAEHRLLFEGITKFNAEMTDSNQLSFLIRRLFKDAVTGKPGPVHLDLENNSAIWSAIMIRMKATQRYYRAAGSLGWSFPASLGGKCALPDKPVYCFCGDGAFYYHLSEMETAVRNGINTVTVINNNGGLVQVRELLDVVYQGESPESKEECYRFGGVDLSKVAQAMGCWSRRVTDAKDILPAIREAAASGRPAVVEVITSDSYPPNPLPAGQRPLYGFAGACAR